MSEQKVRSDTSLSRHGGIECLILNVELKSGLFVWDLKWEDKICIKLALSDAGIGDRT